METVIGGDGREWRISINAATVERVREETGVDLFEYGMQGEHEDPSTWLMIRLRADPILLTKVLYSLCRRQADADGIGWEAFAAAFSDDPLWNGLVVMENEIANFTVSPDRRESLKAAIAKMAELMNATHRYVREKTLEAVSDPTIGEQHARELAKLGERFGRTPGSPRSDGPTIIPTAS